MEETRKKAKEEFIYEYKTYPKNVRQIGVPLPGYKIYLEDYVITYLKQNFMHAQEPVLIVLFGKKGQDDVQNTAFVYGAMQIGQQDILEQGRIGQEIWQEIYQSAGQAFPGAEVLGWACGMPAWNSEMDKQVRRLQKAEFAREEQALFLWDLSEKEEKLFVWQRGMLKEMSGYYIYFEKNPQMQNFMLDSNETESIDADYEDTVTSSMRQVIEEKEEKKRNMQLLAYCGAVAAGIALLFGIHTMLDSTARIQKMEQTVDSLTEYVGQQQEDVKAMSHQADQQVKEIPYQKTAYPDKKTEEKAGVSHRKTTEQPVQAQKEEYTQQKKNVTPKGEKEKQTQASVSGRQPKQKATSVKKEKQSYIVKKGDTLSQIVWKQYRDLSYEKKVRKANGLKNANEIYVGQCIVLPDYK